MVVNSLIIFKPICIVMLVLASCSTGTTYYDDYDDTADFSVYDTEVKEFSGVCYNQNKNALLAVSDLGDIYEIEFDGSTRRKLPYRGKNDFEAIAIDHNTGEIYLADEAENKVFKLASSDAVSLTEVVAINIAGAVGNKGLEGVSIGEDTLYITNQASPTLLIKYCLSTKVEKRIEPGFATYFSDICYDPTDKSLWILDSKKKLVSHCDLNGKVIAQQSVSMIKKPEALLVDALKKTIWIGCDETSRLYKIGLTIQ